MKLFCTVCEKEITKTVCLLSQKNYHCVGCFANFGSFSSNYQVLRKPSYPIIDDKWDVLAQMTLLHSIQIWNYGNWKEIKKQMQFYGYLYSEKQIRAHYDQFYHICLQENSSSTFKYIQKQKVNFIQSKKQQILLSEFMNDALNTITTYRKTQLPKQELTYKFSIDKKPKIIKLGTKISIQGYNNLRGEFIQTYDEEAQQMLVNLQFRQDQNIEQRAMKLQIIEQYNRRIKKRYQAQNNILKSKQLQKSNKKDESFLPNISQSTKQIAKFCSWQQYHNLLHKLQISMELKETIESLRYFRANSKTGKIKDIPNFIKNCCCKKKNPHKIVHINPQLKNKKLLTDNPICSKEDFQIIKNSLSKDGQKFIYNTIEAFIIPK